ncbi:MAG TPA: class I lanthipeptide [Frankiaceae bacterium]|jgi:hypothetical protein|nr:class I lanthipeptide [Frankiaceae bacterium]
MKKTLSLRKEVLSRLDDDELADVVGGTATFTCGCTSALTEGVSCGGVCSVNCGDTFGCPSALLTLVPTV